MNEASFNVVTTANTNTIDVSFASGTVMPLSAELGTITRMGGSSDYKRLENLPSINGTKLIDNYDEIDPTVPDWAKSDAKPNYTADEVGAINENNEMSYTAIKEIWDSYF